MRVEFAQAIIESFKKNPKIVFLTGDLGYMALEGVREALGERFMNVGISEQNMITMAAALAHEGFIPFVYSISPFTTLRPYEQLRNDVCLHNLPVKVVGNGGGYGYGIMGCTHHNIEDIGAMRLLPGMQVYVPFNGTDVAQAVDAMLQDPNPNYLRLNLGSKLPDIPAYAQWRQIKKGTKATIVGTGPVTENILSLPNDLTEGLDVWVVSKLPIMDIPATLVDSINTTGRCLTIEEHAGQCGLNETFAAQLIGNLTKPIVYKSQCAHGYPSGYYGDQKWHQAENGLLGEGLASAVAEVLK